MTQVKPRSLTGVVKESETRREAVALLAAETPIEVVLTHLRARDFNKIATINFLVRHAEMSLKSAKQVVDTSATWSDRLEDHQRFHEELEKAAIEEGFVVVPAKETSEH